MRAGEAEHAPRQEDNEALLRGGQEAACARGRARVREQLFVEGTALVQGAAQVCERTPWDGAAPGVHGTVEAGRTEDLESS